MSNIAYNETVTAEELNNIAVDLGANDFSTFTDGTPYAVTRLNDITATLVTAGILASGDRCEPVIQDEKVCIQPGVIVFNNGAKKRITSSVSVELKNGTYIYAENDVSLNYSQIVISTREPTEGDFVMIAYINADGELTDKRQYSLAKVQIPAGGMVRKFTAEVPCQGCSIEVDVGNSDFSYVFIESAIYRGETLVTTYENFSAITEDQGATFDLGRRKNDVWLTVSFSKKGQYLTVEETRASGGTQVSLNFGVV